MKTIFYTLIFSAAFFLVACKQNKPGVESNKDLLILQDPAMSGSYLTDTGVVSTAAMRNSTIAPNADDNTYTSAPRKTGTANTSVRKNTSGASRTASSGTVATTPARKKGISKAAKGAIIGGVGGAAAGAVIGKNAKGAVIGGVIGAAGGYIIGRQKDKKDGRVQ